MPGLLIHIGYHKTATTWLQSRVFTNAAAGYATVVPADALLERVVRPKPFDFDPVRCRAEWRPAVSRATDDGLVAVLSAERLSGNPHSGGYDAHEIGVRLHRVFPEAKILIVVREQVGAIASCYRQYVKVGGTLPLGAYLNPPRDFRVPQFDCDFFQYHRLVEHYRDRFGADRVLVLAYEEFRERPLTFLSRLHAFAESGVNFDGARLPVGERANLSLAAGVVWLQRQANRIAAEPTTINPRAWLRGAAASNALASAVRAVGAAMPGGWHRGAERRVESRIRERVGDRYASSNRRLAALVDLPLAVHGYRL